MKRIETLLRRTIGLDVAAVGPTALERIVRLRMKALGFKDLTAYFSHVSSTPAEWEELLEAVVVTETGFVRDQTPFKVFVQLAQQELQRKAEARSQSAVGRTGDSGVELLSEPVRVLSIPCATGEEPYSLAMALCDAGVAGHQITLDAVDISARALARAQHGLYGKNSFRGKALAYRDRHFTVAGNGFLLNRAVRERVRFVRGNLLDEGFIANRPPYDFVFCRNLLIYFDRATRQRALQRLRRLLKPAGVLFVGASELPLVLENGFTPIGLPMSFACRQTSPEFPVPRSEFPVPSCGPRNSELGTRNSGNGDSCLTAARALADAGQLEPAAALCKTQIKTHGPSAAAYYLLGLVCDAAGDPGAMEYYRKALYLESDHYETLLQMALLLERNGDHAAAKTYRRRAARLEPRP